MFDQIKNFKNLAGMMGSLGNLGEIKERVERVQTELGQKTVMAESGAGAVRVTMNGRFEVIGIQVDHAMVSVLAGVGTEADRAMVEELIASAMNAAVQQTQELLKETLTKEAVELGIPGAS